MVACKLAASSDSTGGGIKMIRTLIVIKQAEYAFLKLLHPAAISPLKNWQPRGVRQYRAFGIRFYLSLFYERSCTDLCAGDQWIGFCIRFFRDNCLYKQCWFWFRDIGSGKQLRGLE